MPQHPLRLAPLPDEEWDDRARAAVTALLPPERANARDAGNILATMVRHPDLTRAYLKFNAYLLIDSTLSARVREIALLRIVHRRDCALPVVAPRPYRAAGGADRGGNRRDSRRHGRQRAGPLDSACGRRTGRKQRHFRPDVGRARQALR